MGKKVWVIGGARGIGGQIVVDLAHAGYDVSFTYRSSAQDAKQLTTSLNSEGFSVQESHLELSDPDMLDAFAAQLECEKDLYGIVFCPAVKYDSLLATTKDENISELFKTNVLSAITLVRSASKPMSRARNGRIVLISSIAAQRTGRGNSIYAATKGALESFCKSVANEMAPRGVTINCISPGFIDTKMMEGYGSLADGVVKSLPSRRVGSASEVASAVPFLLSDGASYINGSVLVVDGAASGSFSA